MHGMLDAMARTDGAQRLRPAVDRLDCQGEGWGAGVPVSLLAAQAAKEALSGSAHTQ